MTSPTLSLTTFDDSTSTAIADLLKQQHSRIAQLDRPTNERSLTARNYGSAMNALGNYLRRSDATLPTKSVLTQWRDNMRAGRADDTGKVYSTSTINARLAAARKPLRAVADDTTDIHVKLVLTS
jgi:hypothetical protein